jgi:hypothetical protein
MSPKKTLIVQDGETWRARKIILKTGARKIRVTLYYDMNGVLSQIETQGNLSDAALFSLFANIIGQSAYSTPPKDEFIMPDREVTMSATDYYDFFTVPNGENWWIYGCDVHIYSGDGQVDDLTVFYPPSKVFSDPTVGPSDQVIAFDAFRTAPADGAWNNLLAPATLANDHYRIYESPIPVPAGSVIRCHYTHNTSATKANLELWVVRRKI